MQLLYHSVCSGVGYHHYGKRATKPSCSSPEGLSVQDWQICDFWAAAELQQHPGQVATLHRQAEAAGLFTKAAPEQSEILKADNLGKKNVPVIRGYLKWPFFLI